MSDNIWPEVLLDSHVDLLSGYPFKSKDFTDNSNDIPLVKGENLHQGYIDWVSAKRLDKKNLKIYNKYILSNGDIVLAMDRPWIGAGLKYSWIKPYEPKCLLVQRVCRMRGINGLTTDYLRYLIGSQAFTNYIKPIVTGVNVPHISASQIKAYRFKLPPINLQSKISCCLSAYDDLMENNNRRIKILEEMVQLIYREWFVNFRFPGHERIKMVESELGMIPKGWDVSKLGDICHIVMGQSPKSEFYNQDRQGLPFHQGVTNFGTYFPNDKNYCTVVTREAESSDILFSVRAPVGRINVADKHMCIGRGLSAIRSKNDQQLFVLFQLKDKFQVEDSIGNGAIFNSVTKEDVFNIKMVQPPSEIAQRFCMIAEPMWKEIKLLTHSNKCLNQTRDLLLPRLISGDINVENLVIKCHSDIN